MWRWFSPRQWQRYAERMRRREQLALMLWPYLPEAQRTRDDMQALRLLNTMVRQLEAGNDDFSGNEPASALWQRARADNDVQQCCGALRTLHLQAQGNLTVQGLQVATLARKEMRKLRQRMTADNMGSELNLLQQLPVLLPVMSALLLVSGWFFNSVYLGRLGVPVSHYFGLTDYLAASMEGLLPGVAAIGFTVLLQWMYRARIRLQSLQRLLGSQMFMQMLVLFAMLSMLYWFPLMFGEVRQPYVTVMRIYVLAIVLMTILLPWLAGFSQRPAHSYLLLNLVSLYLVVLWFAAEIRYLKVLEDRPVLTEIRLADAPNSPLRWRILTGNSLYLFMRDEQKEMHVVPLEQVLSIRHLPDTLTEQQPGQ